MRRGCIVHGMGGRRTVLLGPGAPGVGQGIVDDIPGCECQGDEEVMNTLEVWSGHGELGIRERRKLSLGS